MPSVAPSAVPTASLPRPGPVIAAEAADDVVAAAAADDVECVVADDHVASSGPVQPSTGGLHDRRPLAVTERRRRRLGPGQLDGAHVGAVTPGAEGVREPTPQ